MSSTSIDKENILVCLGSEMFPKISVFFNALCPVQQYSEMILLVGAWISRNLIRPFTKSLLYVILGSGRHFQELDVVIGSRSLELWT